MEVQHLQIYQQILHVSRSRGQYVIFIIRRIGNNNWYFELERCCFIWGSVSHRAASLSVEFEPFLYWSLQSCTDTACILVHMKFPASQHPNDRWTATKKKTHANTAKRSMCRSRERARRAKNYVSPSPPYPELCYHVLHHVHYQWPVTCVQC